MKFLEISQVQFIFSIDKSNQFLNITNYYKKWFPIDQKLFFQLGFYRYGVGMSNTQ